MKCIFCNQAAGFMKSYHDSCYNEVQITMKKIEKVIENYKNVSGNKQTAKECQRELISLVASNKKYRNYLDNSIVMNNVIRTNETVIYVEKNLIVDETKNRSKMIATGYRYEKKPVWNQSTVKIGNSVTVAFTEKAIYFIEFDKALRYELSKVVNLDYKEDKWDGYYTFFDLKTTSPYPHRFTIRSLNKKAQSKIMTVCLFIKCLSGY